MTTDETKVDLDAVFVIAGEVGAEKIQQNSGRVSFEFPWGIAYSHVCATIYDDGLLFWSGDIRWEVIDKLRPLIEPVAKENDL